MLMYRQDNYAFVMNIDAIDEYTLKTHFLQTAQLHRDSSQAQRNLTGITEAGDIFAF